MPDRHHDRRREFYLRMLPVSVAKAAAHEDRARAVLRARACGLKIREIAEFIGVTNEAVAQMIKRGQELERGRATATAKHERDKEYLRAMLRYILPPPDRTLSRVVSKGRKELSEALAKRRNPEARF